MEHYAAYYSHCDSYPTWLGAELAELLKQDFSGGSQRLVFA
jgi:hypothetical protein